jgi:hypothetical protein
MHIPKKKSLCTYAGIWNFVAILSYLKLMWEEIQYATPYSLWLYLCLLGSDPCDKV